MKTVDRRLFPGSPNKQLGPNPIGGSGDNSGGVGGAPVAFNASVSVTPGQSGVNLDVKTLQSGFRRPYWIDEIRISMLLETPVGKILTGLSGAVGLKFTTGNYGFSRNFVPVGLYAPRFQNDYEELQLETGVGPIDVSYVRWLLPKPLYMPAGDAIQASVEYTDYTPFTTAEVGSPIEVNVTYVGRDIAPGSPPPRVRNVPWVASVVKDAGTAYASYGNQFRNPFLTQWQIQRLTSRSYYLTEDSGTQFQEDGVENAEYFGILPGPSVTNQIGYTEVQLYDSIGYDILREWTPIGMVFDTARAAWTFNRALGPRQQLNMNMRHVTGSASPSDTNTFYNHVAAVGYREERV